MLAALLFGLVEAKTVPETNFTVTSRACQGAFSSLPYCNTALPLSQRVQDFVDRLFANRSWIPPQLTARHNGGGNPGPSDAVPELGLPEYDWGLNCIHGVQSSCVKSREGTVYCPTSFMNPVNFGATWNDSLTLEMGRVIATETRALWLAGATEESSWSGMPHIGLDLWSPNINIARDPRWGRNQEVPSEDPLINGAFGLAYTKGVQEGEDSRYLKTVVTLKHWDAYSLEDADNFTRHNFNAQISPYALETTYFPAFRRAVIEGKAKGIMCSYNAVNGVPTCASPFLTSVLRGKWGFDGYITSDTGALEDIYEQHKYVATVKEAACEALVNGTCDVCSGSVYHDALLECQNDAIRAALIRTFTLRFQLGLFDPIEKQPYWSVPLTKVATEAANELNLLASQSSMVLLKHSKGVLPLAKGKRIAVLGPHASATSALVGNYLGQLCPDDSLSCVQSPFQAISKANEGGKTTMAAGTRIEANDTSWGTALALARDSDIVVLCLGIDDSIEAEDKDRVSIDLPTIQHQFAAAVAAIGKPTVVVLVHGGAIDVIAERDNPNILAILDAFYPGMRGAEAISSTLFGTNEHLGGKMAITSYPAAYTSQIKMSDMELDQGPGRGYRYYTGPVVFPFGFGLSLTSFKLAVQPPAAATLHTEKTFSTTLTYKVQVSNTGSHTGDEVVQAYFSPNSTLAPTLKKQLFGYQRVHLAPGQATEVSFVVSSATLRLTDRTSGDTYSVGGTFDVVFTNGADENFRYPILVTGDSVLVSTFPS